MRLNRLALLAIAAIGLGTVAVLGGNLARSSTAKAADLEVVAPAPKGSGALVICGGGAIPDSVRKQFVDLAGGADARIVVIPTAHSIADRPNAAEMVLAPWKQFGARSLTVFHTRSREKADDAEFLRPLVEATGVWFGGGVQSNLVAAYRGTAVEAHLAELLKRGGVIGGTSAGAAVMTRVMIASGRIEAKLGEGFDFLPGSVVDQHFLKRNRYKRLMGVLNKNPNLLGFGIDEQTALIVRGRRLDVVGNSYVVACQAAVGDQGPRTEFLKGGDQADLDSLRGPRPIVLPSLKDSLASD
ncbi:cyanophycinase [Isosphaeraceae bacterium EP7]